MTYPTLAGDRDTSFAAPVQLFAGEAQVATDSAPALANIPQWTLCVLLATGITPFVPATHTTAFPDKLVINEVAVTTGQQCPYYAAGKFNHQVITWPAAYDTFAKRKELLLGSMLQVGHLI